MTLNIVVSDTTYAGLQRIAADTQATVEALCYNAISMVANDGVARNERDANAALLSQLKAAKGSDTKADIEAKAKATKPTDTKADAK